MSKPEWQLEEFKFPNRFVSRLRRLWYEIAAQWALRHLINQQNHINREIYQQIAQQLDQVEWLTAQDKELVELRHQVSELRTQLIKTQKQVASLEERLKKY